MDLIIELANVDLMRQKDVWLDRLSNIKRLVDVTCGDKDTNLCRKWRLHCDVQLYKILEIQYLRGIE